jgi:hypothetical protein
MQHRRRISQRLKVAGRFLAIWYVAVCLSFPLIVLALGFRLADGWSVLAGNPWLWISFCGLPLYCIPIAWIAELNSR